MRPSEFRVFLCATCVFILTAFTAADTLAIDVQSTPGDLAGAVKRFEFPSRRVDPAAAAALEKSGDWQRFRSVSGPGWAIRANDLQPGAAAILGGAIPAIPGPANGLGWASVAPGRGALGGVELRDFLLARARDTVSEFPALFPVAAMELVPPEKGSLSEVNGGRIRALTLHQVHEGIRVEGARLLYYVNNGNLIYIEALDLAPVTEPSRPAVGADASMEAIGAYLGGDLRGLEAGAAPRLSYVPVRREEGLGHRLVWEWRLQREGEVHTWKVLVDARTGEVVSFEDANRYACSLDPQTPPGKAIGGVKPDQATDEEKVWGFENLMILNGSSQVTDPGGGFVWDPEDTTRSFLHGRYFQVFCQDGCEMQPYAETTGNVLDFGIGGEDEVSNGTSTPSGRTTWFHATAIRTLAKKWVGVDWLDDNVPANVNIDAACNAFWDGESINFYREGNGCWNTGEIRDVISHEWGHGFDQNDGIGPRDSARGEAVSDMLAALLDRDSCIGESFRQSGGDSDNCSGVRDIMEDAPGGKPVLTVGNVKDYFPDLPPGQGCRGPLNEECHWEGYVSAQAHWHLGQSLLNGVDAENPGLGPEAAWHVLERMYFGSSPVAITYVPWVHPDSPADPPDQIPTGPGDVPGGTSMYLGYLLADDEGDGLANGTPHAAYVNEAFSHHEMEDDMDPATPEVDLVPDVANCTPPADPSFQLAMGRDPATGAPRVEITWTDTPGADTYAVYRARSQTDGMFPVASGIPSTVTSASDPSVDLGEEYWYWVAAFDATGCISPGDTKMSFIPGAPLYTADPGVVLDAGGDGDGAADIGETFDLTVPLANTGTATATTVTGRLVASDTRLRVLAGGPASYPDLVNGDPASAPNEVFTLHLAPDPALCGQTLELALEVEADDGCAWVVPVPLPIEADCTPLGGPYLRFAAADVQDGGNARLEPGETNVDLVLTSANIGGADATGVSATLSSLTPGVAVPAPAVRYNDLPAGTQDASRNPPPSIDLDPTLTCGTPASFRLDYVTDQGAFVDLFTLPVGNTSTVLADDFETDQGWSVVSVDPFAGGVWSRGPLERNVYQAMSGNPFGTPATAYATGPSAGGGAAPNSETSLVSPWLDLSTFDAADVSYARWLTVAGVKDDLLRVEMSGDEFRNEVVLLEEVGNEPYWRERTLPIPAGMLKPGVQIRFAVEETNGDSLIEAAVDDVTLLGHECSALTPGAAVRFVGFTVDDAIPFGNGDGFADPGEVVTLLLDITNVAAGTATNVQAALSSPTAGVDPSVNPTSAFTPEPLPGLTDAASVADHVAVQLDPTITCGLDAELIFDLTWQGGSYQTTPQALRIGQEIVVMEDNFESDLGWTAAATVDNPVRGAWQRVEPQAGVIAASEDNPFGTGTFAFVTGNGAPQNFREYAVWNNNVWLTSPAMDLSDYNSARVSFFHHHIEFRFGGTPMPLIVEGSNDGFNQVSVPLASIEGGSGWTRVEAVIPSELLTDNFQLRFAVLNRPNAGLVDSAVDDVRILGDFCPGAPLSAEFVHNAPVCDGEPVRFVSLAGGPVDSIEWDLDGDGQFGAFAEESMEDPVYTYPTWGTTTVTLRVWDAIGVNQTSQQDIEVRERPAPSIDQEPGTDEEGIPLDFAGSATGGDGLYLFEWDFGDGQNATGPSVQNTYNAPGVYTVTLTVTDSDGDGCPQTTQTQVTIQPNRPPDPILNLRMSRVAADESLDFSWDGDIRAEDYNLYGGDLGSVGDLDPDCVLPGNVPTNANLAAPAAGSRYYLVTGRNFQGEGAMDSSDVVRDLPPRPCN